MRTKIISAFQYNQIINEVYKNYLIDDSKILPNMLKEKMMELGYRLSKEDFINKIKTDDEFSKTWSLKIEEQELSLKERYHWYIQTHNKNLTRSSNQFDIDDILNSNNCPTKLITITYKNTKIETYE